MIALIIPVIILFTTCVSAKDFGTYGDTYTIKEVDILEDIKRKLSIHQENGELERFEQNYKREVAKQIKSPSRVVGIIDAKEDRRRVFDPTTTLEEDILVPITSIEDARKNPNNIEYRVLHKAGKRINPLEYMKFNEPLIFVDGNNQKQLTYAREYQDNNPLAKIILIDGKPGFKEVAGKEYQYFFDQMGAYSERFQIVRVPSIVYQKEGDKVLTIDEIKLEEE